MLGRAPMSRRPGRSRFAAHRPHRPAVPGVPPMTVKAPSPAPRGAAPIVRTPKAKRKLNAQANKAALPHQDQARPRAGQARDGVSSLESSTRSAARELARARQAHVLGAPPTPGHGHPDNV